MLFSDNFKLFAFGVLNLVACIQARSVSYSQFGDIRIVHEDDKWICDKIECPEDSYRCYVSKSNEKDPAVVVRTNICFARNGTSLAESITSTSVDPKHKVRVEVIAYNNGMTTTSNSYIGDKDFNEEEFQKNLQKELQGIQSNVDNEMKNLHANLEDMNKNIQANIQNQMNELQTNLQNMKYDLEHMFD